MNKDALPKLYIHITHFTFIPIAAVLKSALQLKSYLNKIRGFNWNYCVKMVLNSNRNTTWKKNPALVSIQNNLTIPINPTRPKQAIRVHCVSYHQSHYIEVAQGCIFSRAIRNWLWIFSLFKNFWFSHLHLMQLFSADAKVSSS